MEDTKLENSPVSTEPVVQNVAKGNKKKIWIILGIALVVIISGIFVAFMLIKNSKLSLIDGAITSIEALFSETEDLDTEIGDLPENFLEAESVSTQDVDDAIDDLDFQIKELDSIELDFDLEAADVGL